MFWHQYFMPCLIRENYRSDVSETVYCQSGGYFTFIHQLTAAKSVRIWSYLPAESALEGDRAGQAKCPRSVLGRLSKETSSPCVDWKGTKSTSGWWGLCWHPGEENRLQQQLICSHWDCTLGIFCGSRPLSHWVDVSGWPLGFIFGQGALLCSRLLILNRRKQRGHINLWQHLGCHLCVFQWR